MIQLPTTFRSTHLTAGLSGYPAIDVFGDPGEQVKSPVNGKIRRFSGKDPRQGGKPGSAYGWSMYLAADNGDDYYLTHFGTRSVRVGQRVSHGQVIGTICDAAVSGKPSDSSHIHEGLKKARRPMPAPKERLYRIVGPKGVTKERRKTAAQVGKLIPKHVKQLGSVTIKPDERED